jgi:copper chaperone CopZ
MKKLSLMTIAALLLGTLVQAATTAQTTLAIKGMTCGGCVGAVKIQLKRTEGVETFEVSYEKAEAIVAYDPSKTEPKKIAESVSKTGFEASVKTTADGPKAK